MADQNAEKLFNGEITAEQHTERSMDARRQSLLRLPMKEVESARQGLRRKLSQRLVCPGLASQARQPGTF